MCLLKQEDLSETVARTLSLGMYAVINVGITN